MAQLNEIIEKAGAIIALAEKLKTDKNREDTVKLHGLSAELNTIALNLALNTI